MRLILASASPRRAELLAAAGIPFAGHPVQVDERPMAGESPETYVRRLASEKSARVAAELAGQSLEEIVILGADTTVVVDGDILGKPQDVRAARAMIARLSGRPHAVLTGVSLRTGGTELSEVAETTVWFSVIPDEDLDWYAASGEGRDKAGGYAIQGLASRFIPRIEGSYSNVVGLPIATVCRLLARLDGGTVTVASAR